MTTISPVAPAATFAVMVVALVTVNDAASIPPNVTLVAPVKLVPVMVTVSSVVASVGVNDAMVGLGTTGGVGSLSLLLQETARAIIKKLFIISQAFLIVFIFLSDLI